MHRPAHGREPSRDTTSAQGVGLVEASLCERELQLMEPLLRWQRPPRLQLVLVLVLVKTIKND